MTINEAINETPIKPDETISGYCKRVANEYGLPSWDSVRQQYKRNVKREMKTVAQTLDASGNVVSTVQKLQQNELLTFDLPIKRVSTNITTGQQWVIQQKDNEVNEFNYDEFGKKIIEQIKKIKTLPKTIVRDEIQDGHLMVVDLSDIHIGKLATSFETGEEYNNQIAVQRCKEGLEGLIKKSSGYTIEKILFVGGNDILHIDTPKRTTTSGTAQDTDGQWDTNYLIAKKLYIDLLNRLLEIANVHFVFNPSNHDYMSGFMLADVIQTYFKDCDNITFDCTTSHRKYFTYGSNAIGTTHGDGARNEVLPMLMATECKSWSECKHRYIYTHHIHHKTLKDFPGVTIESLRSPSGTDSWHHRNGYQHAPKAVEAFIHHPVYGQSAKLIHIF